MRFGQWVSDCRKESGMTIDQLAEKSGVPKGTLNKIISGDTKEPSLDKAFAIAHALGKTLDDYAPPRLDVENFSTPIELEKEEGSGDTRRQKLLHNYDSLTEAGQDRLAEYADLLMLKEEYRKDSEQKPVKMVRVFQAARSSDNTPPEWVDRPEEEVEKIFNAPDADIDF